MQVILFDIDYTLLVSAPSPQRAFDTAFFEYFKIESAWSNSSPYGNTYPRIVQEIAQKTLKRPLSPTEFENLYFRYDQLLVQELESNDSFKVLPGVKGLCEMLKNRNDVMLGLQTGNLTESAYHKLERGGLERYFSFGGFGTDGDTKNSIVAAAFTKANEFTQECIQPERDLWIVGDAPQDIHAGLAIGARTIGVATGTHTVVELMAAGATYAFSDLNETETILKLIAKASSLSAT